MLALTNGIIAYGDKKIHCPDIKIIQGDIIGLAGVSGIGKSSLARVLAGIEPNFQGELQIPKHHSSQANPVQWAIQQPEFAFNPRLTLEQSLLEAWKDDTFICLMDKFELALEWLKRRPKALSGGQLQRFNLLRALMPTTQFLICDEITAHLDMLTQQKIWQSLLNIAHDRQLGLLVISHDNHLLDKVCQQVIHWPKIDIYSRNTKSQPDRYSQND